MKYISHGSLQRYVIGDGEDRLTATETAIVMYGVTVMLQYMHTVGGICHRDVKPDNILLDKKNRPRLADFGLARSDIGGDKTVWIGTVCYAAPEVMTLGDDDGDYDHKCDVFSLGLVLWQLVAQRRPYDDMRMFTLIKEKRNPESVNKLLKRCPEIGKYLEEIIRSCLEIEQDDRCDTCAVRLALKESNADLFNFEGDSVDVAQYMDYVRKLDMKFTEPCMQTE